MHGLQPIRIVRIRPKTAVDYAAFTYGRYRDLLQKCENPVIVALGGEWWGKPVGLCLASVHVATGRAMILSLFTHAEHRHQGVGSLLLSAVESAVFERGCISISASYLTDWPGIVILEHLLCKSGWEIRRESKVIRGNIGSAALLAKTFKNARLRPDCNVSLWTELSAEDRRKIRETQEQLGYPDELSPFAEEDSIASNSVVLRHQGCVAGWHITHRVPPDSIRHSWTFIRPDLRATAQGCVLIAESVRRHAESQLATSAPRCFFHVGVDNQRMLNLFEKRIRPAIDSEAWVCRAVKSFAPPM